VSSYGIPLALYHDRHGIFERSKREPKSLEEQLEGRRKPTQLGRLMKELRVTSHMKCEEVYLTPYTPIMASASGPVVALSFYS
jgi:hypothetical protein